MKQSYLRIGERAGKEQDDWSRPGLTGEVAFSVPEGRINWHGLQCGVAFKRARKQELGTYAGVTSAYNSLFSANCTVLHHWYRPEILEGGREVPQSFPSPQFLHRLVLAFAQRCMWAVHVYWVYWIGFCASCNLLLGNFGFQSNWALPKLRNRPPVESTSCECIA